MKSWLETLVREPYVAPPLPKPGPVRSGLLNRSCINRHRYEETTEFAHGKRTFEAARVLSVIVLMATAGLLDLT